MQVAALTQNEIDALLANLGSSTASQGKSEQVKGDWKSVKPYDFRRPDKFSKEQLRAIQVLHENFARMMASSLSARLRTMIHTSLSSVDQGVYSEYVKTIPTSTILSVISLDPLPGNVFMELGPEIASALIDRLLGGVGRPTTRQHSLTDIEMSLVRGVINTALQDLTDTWGNIVQLTAELQEIILNPRLIQMAFQGDAVIIMVFEIKIADTVGTMGMCYPFTVLESVLPKLSGQSWVVTSRKNRPTENLITLQNELVKVNVPVSLILGTADISVEELIEIQPGDVIPLDRRVSEELELVVGDHPKYLAQPGKLGHKLAARVTRLLDDKEEFEIGHDS